MAATLDDVLAELKAVHGLLNRLLVPVHVEEARQVLSMNNDELKAHNREFLKRVRQKQGQKRRVAA